MNRKFLRFLVIGALLFTAACEPVEPKYATFKEALEDIPGVSVTYEDAEARTYVLRFVLEVDHENASAGTFLQLVSVLFRGFDRPTILVTEGYLWEEQFDVNGLLGYIRKYIY